MAVRAFPRVAAVPGRCSGVLWQQEKTAQSAPVEAGFNRDMQRGAHSRKPRRSSRPPINAHVQSDLRFRSGVSFGGNRLTGLELSKRSVKIGLTTIYLEGRETLSASHPSRCDEA